MNAFRALLAAALLAAATTAQAHVVTYAGTFAPEAPGATGTGSVTVDYDDGGHLLAIQATFSGLSGTTTIAHIHCCVATPGAGTAPVAVTPGTLPEFPVGVHAGVYPRNIDLTLTTSYTQAFLNISGNTAAGAEAKLVDSLNKGVAYFNIHTTTFEGGEIRAFLNPVPEPSTVALMLAGLGLLGFAARRGRTRSGS
jgi:hypothetical protein